MIYSINNMSLDSFLYDYTALLLPKDIVVLAQGIVPPISLIATAETNNALRLLSQLSQDKKCLVMAHIKLLGSALPYNSVLTIDNGRLSEAASEIFCGGGYSAGNAIKFLEGSLGLLAITIGNDIFFSDLWRAYKIARPSMCFYFASENSSSRHFAMLKAFAMSCGRSVVCVFDDLSCVVSGDGKVKDIEFGDLRIVNPPKKTFKPRLVDKRIVVRKEVL